MGFTTATAFAVFTGLASLSIAAPAPEQISGPAYKPVFQPEAFLKAGNFPHANVRNYGRAVAVGNNLNIRASDPAVAGNQTIQPPPRIAANGNVCSVRCDPTDPSQAKSESFPTGDVNPNGRVVRLHISDADAMGWASIDNGAAGDGVWMDRTWDGGATWDELLGKVTIPSGWTGTRTQMYNLADPDNHRRGMLRACGDANGIACTGWVHMQACETNGACDGAPASQAQGDYQPVGGSTLSGRTIQLHMDNRGLAWGTISGGAAGDEIWLDRSWDKGNTWTNGGSSLGRVSVPSGSTSTATVMFSTRDVLALLYGGAVRACGRAVTSNNGACTAFARPNNNRPAAGANALMWAYQPDTAWWLSSWWNSAVAITTMMDYMIKSGDRQYVWAVDRTFTVNKAAFPAGVKSTDAIEGDFISRANDDVLWWGVAWSTAYQLTGDSKYLNEAKLISDRINQYYDTSTCNGGIWWSRERTYKNAVTIGLWIKLNAKLHNQISGDTTYLNRGVTAWNWFKNSGLINSAGLVNDGLTSSCANNNDVVWTYNQGLGIGGSLEVYRANKDANALALARRLADAAISSSTLTKNGILTESCETGNCDDNAKQFKGVFMRYMQDLAETTGDANYKNYITTQANSIWNNDRNTFNDFGVHWNGADSSAAPNVRDWRTEASALSALIAAA